MHIIVCIKQVPDPEGPRDAFVINHEMKRVEPRGIPPVLSLFDENALEAALCIKDANKNVRITVLSVGKRISNAIMQKALAAGADELVKVEDSVLDSSNLDSYGTASALATAIKKIGNYDLILVGRQAADWNAGQTGVGIAYLLDVPAITLAARVEIEDDYVKVKRVIQGGYEIVKSPLPSVVMVSNEVGELRYPTILQRREARKKTVITWNAKDIGIVSKIGKKVILRHLHKPVIKQTKCQIINGDLSPSEAGRKLAEKLLEIGCF